MFPHESDYELKNIQEICGLERNKEQEINF